MSKRSPSQVGVNAPATTNLMDYSALIAPRPRTARAPIDNYYSRVTELVRISGQTWCDGQLLGLLTVDLVGTVELYVRSVLVGIVELCPEAKRIAGRKQVPIAAVGYYPHSELAYAVIDHLPLSDPKTITATTQNLAGFAASGNGSLEAALEAFDKVCHLRHAITHQNGRLGPNNLLELGVDVNQPSVVALDALKFQKLVATCHSLVRAYNQFIFDQTVERWANIGRFSFDWSKDEIPFRALCALLVSREDSAAFEESAAYLALGGLFDAAKKKKKAVGGASS